MLNGMPGEFAGILMLVRTVLLAVRICITVLAPLAPPLMTYRALPFGVNAIAPQPNRQSGALLAVFVAVLIRKSPSGALRYAVLPFGATANPCGSAFPIVIAGPALLVAVSTGVTVVGLPPAVPIS